MAATDVSVAVLIRRRRDDVAAFMFDPAHDKQWTSGVVACHPLTPGRLRAGSEVERTVRFIGREFTYRYSVISADDDQSVEMHVERPFPMQVRYELEDAPDGTRVRIRAKGDAGRFFAVAAPLLRLMVRRNIGRDLDQLRVCLEATPA